MTLTERTLSYTTLNALRACVKLGTNFQSDTESNILHTNYISVANAKANRWWITEGNPAVLTFDGLFVPGSYLNNKTRQSDGKTLCNDILTQGLGLWGYSDGLALLCDVVKDGVKGVPRSDGSSCATGSGDRFGDISSYSDAIYAAVKNKVYNGKTPSLQETLADGTQGYPGRYLLYKDAFLGGCKAKQSLSAPADFKYTKVKIVIDDGSDQDGTFTEYDYEGVARSETRNVYVDRDNLNWVSKSCADIANEVNKYASDYVKYRKANKNESSTTTDVICADNASKCASDSEPTCGNQVSGLGWILCPIIDGLTNLNDAVWGVVSGLLKVSPLRADGSQSIYSAWGILRGLANVAFIIVFLLMIFSQLTNFGVSNYGVKKLLPRLLISALLVNLSFVIVQISVDLANILGSGLYDLLTGLSPNGVQPPSWNDLIGNILAGAGGVALGVGGLALAGGVATAFWLLLPVAAMGALSLLAAIFTLIFRQAIIPILAILAPLAFVAYMLPNTETWFKKWRDLMLSMLMLYPLAAVLFGGAQFASTVIMGTGDKNWWTTLLGLIVLTLPLFALPFLARQGGPLLGKVGGALNNLAQKARNPINNYTKARADMSRERYGAGSPNKANLSRRLFQSAASRNRTVATRTEGYKKEAEENYKKAMVGDPETGDPSKLKGGARRARAAHDRLDFQNLRGENNDAVLSRALEEKKASNPEFKRMVEYTRAQNQAKKTAVDAQTKNYATSLETDPTLLRIAGGRVDSAGQAKASAYGKSALESLRAENVKAYTTHHKSQGMPDSIASTLGRPDIAGDPSLMGVLLDPSKSSEEREAATRAIIDGGSIDTIAPAMDYLVAERKATEAVRASAVAAGNPVAVAAAEARIAELQPLIQSVGDSIGSSPGKSIAWGGGEISAWKSGDYESATAPASMPSSAQPDFDALGATEKQLVATLTSKSISAKSVPGIDKKDLASILKLVQLKILPPETAKAIREKLDEALSDPNIYTDIKDRETGYILRAIEEIDANMTAGGITPPPTRRPRIDSAGNARPAIQLTDLAPEFQTP